MKNLLMAFFLIGIVFPNAANADICNRTQLVVDAIAKRLAETSPSGLWPNCEGITLEQLASIDSLTMRRHSREELVELRPGDFAGLVNLQILNFSRARLAGEIPAELGSFGEFAENLPRWQSTKRCNSLGVGQLGAVARAFSQWQPPSLDKYRRNWGVWKIYNS